MLKKFILNQKTPRLLDNQNLFIINRKDIQYRPIPLENVIIPKLVMLLSILHREVDSFIPSRAMCFFKHLISSISVLLVFNNSDRLRRLDSQIDPCESIVGKQNKLLSPPRKEAEIFELIVFRLESFGKFV